MNLTNDFSDRLSPIVVKELRQDLRGKGFLILFITLQIILSLILLLTATLSSSSQDTGTHISQLIFFCFSFCLLIVQPLRGCNGISSELKAKTLDMLQLTRMSAWSIVFGKWISLVAQSLLIASAILPYLIMRYFFGNMQILPELTLLMTILVFSGFFSAITVGLSATPSILLRGIIPLIGSMFVFISIAGAFSNSYSFNNIIEQLTFTDSDFTAVFIAIIAGSLYTSWLMLEIATSIIAPLAENRDTIKRVIGFIAAVIVSISLMFANTSPEAIIMGTMAVITPLFVSALIRTHQLVPSICKPFVKRGRIGQLAGRLLYPGWATGTFYCTIIGLLLLPVMITICSLSNSSYGFQPEDLSAFIAYFGILIFPAAITQLFFKKYKNLFTVYLLIFCIHWGFMILLGIMAATTSDDVLLLFCWLPVGALALSFDNTVSDSSQLVISCLVTGTYLIILWFKSIPAWKHIREVESVALKQIANSAD
ncbi:hypothetical protein [Persicirhabdus sediminis]|uniref:Uncharacterized protein n=1 Tax=Persicirhabdus sediminis TaxID=454144 RepID=A0A8J7MFE1_9BACT|nr:hypothetical protein [Persicirhabdus sediminis]MBK1791722.1 hypothetical protein [Persicirhabdus sediminis]